MIPLRDGTDYEIPEDFVRELNALYYGVETEFYRMRLWCLANPDRRKTKRGARRFVFNWINKACQVRPKAREVCKSVQTRIVPVSAEPLEVRKENLARLKEALKS